MDYEYELYNRIQSFNILNADNFVETKNLPSLPTGRQVGGDFLCGI